MASLAFSLLAPPADAQSSSSAGNGTYTWTQTNSSSTVTAQSPTYSGGQFTCSGNSDGTDPYTWNYTSDSSGYGNPEDEGPYNCQATGTIATTFTWAGANGQPALLPPPTAAVVEEVSTVSAKCYGATPPAPGQCDTGLLGNSVSSLGQGQVTLTSTRYTGSTGGATVNLSCSPSSSCPVMFPQVDVRYLPTLSPVTISLTGATLDSSGNYNILVGQGCTASLVGVPSSCTVSNWQWSVSDPTFTYQQWSGATQYMPPASANPNASYYVGGPGPLNNPTTHWYWDDNAGKETITCTATVTPPAGQGSAFSITAAQSVILVVPQTTENPTLGSVQLNNHAPTGYGANYALYLGGTGPSQPYGIIYATQVLTPALFASSSYGLWNLVQGVAPNTWYTTFPNSLSTPSSGNGSSGLDTHYPLYPWSSGSSPFFPSGVTANNLLAQPYDGPGIANLSNTISEYRVSDSFQTYVMYLPPGSDTQWVPVWLITWHWNADDTAPIVNGQPVKLERKQCR